MSSKVSSAETNKIYHVYVGDAGQGEEVRPPPHPQNK
jgi:hypothetical protein